MPSLTTYDFRYFALLFVQLETEYFNGKVLAEANQRSAVLYFAEGRLLHVVTESLVGEDALYNLLSWGEGHFTIEAQPQPIALSPSLDEHQLSLLRTTLKLLQTKGRFEQNNPLPLSTPEPAQSEVVSTAELPTSRSGDNSKEAVKLVASSNSTEQVSDPLMRMISQPVEWGVQLQAQPVAVVSRSEPKTPAELKLGQLAAQAASELEHPVSFNLAAPATAMTKNRRPALAPVRSDAGPPEVSSDNQCFRCLPPGTPTEPGTRLENFKLTELVCRVAQRWSNAYILIGMGAGETGLLLIEQGQISAVRYVRGSITLKAQAAYNALEKATRDRPGEVSVYESEVKLLRCYRTLFGGNYLLTNVQASTLDVAGLVGEYARRGATITLRLFNGDQLVFYFIHQGEALGSFQLNRDRLERGGDVRALVRDPRVRLDLLEAGPAETIELGLTQMLQPNQASLLTEAASCVLQVLATLAGPGRVLAVTRRILENSASLFPCLQRLGVDERENQLTLSWTLDQTQAFVSRVEAQTAFNFLLTALFNHHDTLLDPLTLRELAHRAIFNQHLELEKENLALDCLRRN